MGKSGFTLKDVGCYADGTLGHQHLRNRLAEEFDGFFRTYKEGAYWTGNSGNFQLLWKYLCGPIEVDCWEEQDALDLLNEHACDETVHFTFDAGDLLLVAVNEELQLL